MLALIDSTLILRSRYSRALILLFPHKVDFHCDCDCMWKRES